jgi:hypothetical protein
VILTERGAAAEDSDGKKKRGDTRFHKTPVLGFEYSPVRLAD